MTSLFRIPALLVVLFAACLAAPGADAQSLAVPSQSSGGEAAIALPDPLTPEAARALVAGMSDSDVRRLLLERLDAVAAEEEAREETGSIVDFLANTLTGVAESIWISAIRAPGVMDGLRAGFGEFAARRPGDGGATLIGALALALALGAAAELATGRFLRLRKGGAPGAPERSGVAGTARALAGRFFAEAGGLIAFFVVALLTLRIALGPPGAPGAPELGPATDSMIARAFLGQVVIFPRVILLIVRVLLSPRQPERRILPTDDGTARFLYRQIALVLVLWATPSFLLPFLATHGVPMGELRIGFWFNFVAYAALIYTLWRAREGLAAMFIGADGQATPGERAFARAWPLLMMGVVALNWLLIEAIAAARAFSLLDGRQNLTMLILLLAPVFDTLVRGLVRRMSGVGAETAAGIAARRSYVRIGRVLIGAAAIGIIAHLWRIDVTDVAAAGVGARIAGGLIEVSLVVLAGYLAAELAALWVNRKLAREGGGVVQEDEEAGGEGGGAGGSRLSTVLPLLLGAAKVAIIALTALTALSSLGVDTTALLAGAGIVGLAVGFGAQAFVRDVVSGLFFLVDDAFRVGEYIEIEGTVGTVEKISIRSLQLRHHRGAIHTIPYGEMPKITNFSRDWVIVKMKFTVPFDTDVAKVKKIFKQIGREMMEVPEFAADFLQPFKSQGVFDVDDVGVVVRGKFMARPGRQFTLRKEVYQRVQAAFEAAGIEFARKEVRVHVPGLAGAPPEEREAIAAAAAEAADGAAGPAGGAA